MYLDWNVLSPILSYNPAHKNSKISNLFVDILSTAGKLTPIFDSSLILEMLGTRLPDTANNTIPLSTESKLDRKQVFKTFLKQSEILIYNSIGTWNPTFFTSTSDARRQRFKDLLSDSPSWEPGIRIIRNLFFKILNEVLNTSQTEGPYQGLPNEWAFACLAERIYSHFHKSRDKTLIRDYLKVAFEYHSEGHPVPIARVLMRYAKTYLRKKGFSLGTAKDYGDCARFDRHFLGWPCVGGSKPVQVITADRQDVVIATVEGIQSAIEDLEIDMRHMNKGTIFVVGADMEVPIVFN